MGYVGGGTLGDYKNRTTGQRVSDATYATLPAFLKSLYIPVATAKVATLSPIRIPSFIPAPKPASAPAPVPLPQPVAQPTNPIVQSAKQQIAQDIQKVTPIAAPIVGPAAAFIPPIAEALKTPATVKIAVLKMPSSAAPLPVPASADTATTTGPTSTGGGAVVYNPDGSPAGGAAQEASVTGGGASPLDAIKNLPTVAKIALALGAFALFGRR